MHPSLEYSVDKLLVLLQFDLLVPVLLQELFCPRLLQLGKCVLLLHIFLGSVGHFLSDFQILHFFQLLFYQRLLNLVHDLVLHIVLVCVHAASLLS